MSTEKVRFLTGYDHHRLDRARNSLAYLIINAETSPPTNPIQVEEISRVLIGAESRIAEDLVMLRPWREQVRALSSELRAVAERADFAAPNPSWLRLRLDALRLGLAQACEAQDEEAERRQLAARAAAAKREGATHG